MPYIGKGTYKGARYQVIIPGWRFFFTYGTWTLPYWVGTRIRFKLRVFPTRETRLNDFPLYVRYTPDDYIAELKVPKRLPDHAYETEQIGAVASADRTIEYWIGDPTKVASQLVFSARGVHNDSIILIILSVMLGAIATYILAFVWGIGQ